MSNEHTDVGERWMKAAGTKDVPMILDMLSEEVVLRPPFQAEEVHGKANTLKTFAAFDAATSGMNFDRIWSLGDSAVIESRTEVGGQELHLVDIVTLDESGKIARFEVLARPASAVAALGDGVRAHLASQG